MENTHPNKKKAQVKLDKVRNTINGIQQKLGYVHLNIHSTKPFSEKEIVKLQKAEQLLLSAFNVL